MSKTLKIADLQFADLQFAELQFTELQFADLQFADLQFTELQFTDLQFADLQFTELRQNFECVQQQFVATQAENQQLIKNNIYNRIFLRTVVFLNMTQLIFIYYYKHIYYLIIYGFIRL